MKCASGAYVTGFYGHNDRVGMVSLGPDDHPPVSRYGMNSGKPKYESIYSEFASLLRNKKLMFAADARHAQVARSRNGSRSARGRHVG